MTAQAPVDSKPQKRRGPFAELLKVQATLAVREPYALGGGIGLPIGLLVLFGWISNNVPGNVAGTGLTVIDLWTPTLIVVAFILLAVSLPNTLVRDREIGWLRRVSTTPVHPSRLLAAQLVINLVLAVVAVLIIILGGALLFGASLHVSILPFVVSLVLAIAELFALGLMIVALAPSQVAGQAMGGVANLRSVLPRGSVGESCTGRRTFGNDHVLLAKRSGFAGSARCGLQQQLLVRGAPDDGCLRGHLRVHSDSLFPLAVGHGRTRSDSAGAGGITDRLSSRRRLMRMLALEPGIWQK